MVRGDETMAVKWLILANNTIIGALFLKHFNFIFLSELKRNTSNDSIAIFKTKTE
jgi:hypothetical protein